jgi:hypothetical protein
MSAWIVSKEHIDALVQAGTSTRDDFRVRWYHNGVSHKLDSTNVDAVGVMLWQECYRSVTHRYEDTTDGQRPGPIGLTRYDIEDYTFTRGQQLPLVASLKLIHCYEYQSCEHDGWEASEAQTFCHALRKLLITRLPGYGDAPWGV